ncbi:MAG: hypothetical protein ACYCQI_02790 [Gammaproteobacteria bacterium]
MKPVLGIVLICLSQIASADPVIINNNTNPAPQQQAQQQPQQAPCRANQNDIYDPRVPPAGVYSTRFQDGSSSTVYTTGEKKPYITDNNCGSSTTQPIVQPYINTPSPPAPH